MLSSSVEIMTSFDLFIEPLNPSFLGWSSKLEQTQYLIWKILNMDIKFSRINYIVGRHHILSCTYIIL